MPAHSLSDELAREAIKAWREHDCNYKEAAKSLGVNHNTFRSRVMVAKERGLDRSEGARKAAENAGLNHQEARGGWIHNYDEEGKKIGTTRWTAPDTDTAENFMDRLADAFSSVEPVPEVIAPSLVEADLCTVYPAADMHLGMHAWGKETGSSDYDLKSAERDVEYAFAKVMARTPNSDTAVLLLTGDTFHADDNRAETPQSKHKLDVDSRHYKVLEAGIKIVDRTIIRLLVKHKNVIVRVMRGNHDEHSHLVLSFAIAERYRENSRVTIEKTPRDLFMMKWGKSAIFAHHGDKAKPDRLTLYLSDVCEFWSSTRHRHCFTGHIHHDSAKDMGPLKWESLRAFCPPDAYAASMGFGSRRALQSITFDKRDGEVARAKDPIERSPAD